MLRNLGEKYSPLYFLAALGAGGMSTFFFMYFMFITPHPDTAIPTFESIQAAWMANEGATRTAIAVGYTGLVIFVVLHLVLLAWNLREFANFRGTKAFETIRNSNAGVTLMAIPLTLAMTLNVLFVSGATLVPNLWAYIELLLPMALAVFAVIGVSALVIYGRFLARILNGGFSFEANTGLNQLLAAFAFAMVGVGMSAGAAMSSSTGTVAVGLTGSIFFAVVSLLVFAVMFPLGVKSMLRNGLTPVNSATLWLPVPILTLLSITTVRDSHGLHTLAVNSTGEVVGGSQELLVILTVALAAQVAFLLFGNGLMMRNTYYVDYMLTKKHQSPVAFTLVCPGVAVGVLGFFWLHAGLVQNGVVEKFSAIYFVILALIIAVQAITIVGILVLLRNQLFRDAATRPEVVTKVSNTATESAAEDLVVSTTTRTP